MSEDLQTQTATPESDQGVAEPIVSEPASQSTDSPEQSDNQQKPESVGQVEPTNQTPKQSPDGNRRASEYIKQRLEIKELRNMVQKLQNNNNQNVPAPSKPARKVYTDDEIFQKGLGNFISSYDEELEKRTEERMKEMLPKYLQEYETSKTEQAVKQELGEKYNKLVEEGKYERFQEILKEHPEIDFYGNKDPKYAFDKAMKYLEESEKQLGTPLAPKKSRMGIVGSGTPLNGGQGKPTLAQLRAEKAKLQDQFAERFQDPAFIKKWDDNSESIANLAQQ